MDTKMPDVVVTRPMMGITHMQVCAHKNVDPKDAEDFANRENPAGTEHGWRIIADNSEGSSFAPTECGDDDARIHYLLVC